MLNRTTIVVFATCFAVSIIAYLLIFKGGSAIPIEELQRQERAQALDVVAEDQQLKEQLGYAATFGERADILDQEWQSIDPQTRATDQIAVRAVLDAAAGEAGDVPDKDDLLTLLTTFITANASKDSSKWYGMLASRGHIISDGYRTLMSKSLGLSPPPPDDPLASGRAIAHHADRIIRPATFSLIADEETRMRISSAHGLDRNGNPPSAYVTALQNLRGYAQTRVSAMEAPRTLVEVLDTKGEVTVCEVVIFVRPEEGTIRGAVPIVLYLHHDPDAGRWSLNGAYKFPPRKDESYDLRFYI